MIDTIYPKKDYEFLITRWLSTDFKKWTVLDGDDLVFENVIKANYADFLNYCINGDNGYVVGILHARININGVSELHQYVLWRENGNRFIAATLLNGDEEFKIKKEL